MFSSIPGMLLALERKSNKEMLPIVSTDFTHPACFTAQLIRCEMAYGLSCKATNERILSS